MRPSLLILPLVVGVAFAVPASAQSPDLDPRIVKLLAEISDARLGDIVRKLQSFDTRNTLSTQESPTRGIGAAAQWIHDEMRSYSPRLQVSFDTYDIPAQGDRIVRDTRLRNVMAVLPGKSPRRIYVSGHYDSLARAPRPAAQGTPTPTRPAARAPQAGAVPGSGARPAQTTTGGFDWGAADHTAPGANDDGSGTALTMELARVFGQSGMEFDATLVFIALAGEEQGLVGAKLHGQKAAAEQLPIDAVFNNDMVGNIVGGSGVADAETVRVFSEGPEDSTSRQIARYIRRWAARYVPSHQVRLVARHDRFGRGGDHTAFNQHGFAGVRITEANENYARQHAVEDTFEGVSSSYMARNAQVNAAAVATMALAPQAPRVTSERGAPTLGRGASGYDAALRWAASPGAVAYRVFWREAWTPDWQHEILVGNVTEVVLPDVSIDDYIFGVAAVGPGGHESAVTAYVNPPRAESIIKTKP